MNIGEKTQGKKIVHERGDITTDANEMKRIKRNYYEQLYANYYG